MSFEEFYKKRVEPLSAVPIKEKIEKANAFINDAIDASDIYEASNALLMIKKYQS